MKEQPLAGLQLCKPYVFPTPICCSLTRETMVDQVTYYKTAHNGQTKVFVPNKSIYPNAHFTKPSIRRTTATLTTVNGEIITEWAALPYLFHVS